MGNQQSNERKRNWKLYRITKAIASETYVTIDLDDYVTYKNGNYKSIHFEKGFFYLFTHLSQGARAGSRVAIDLNETRCVDNQHDFVFRDDGGVMKFINGVTSGISETAATLGDIGDVLEARQNFIASVEQSRYATNHVWTKQTSWDMPPGWK